MPAEGFTNGGQTTLASALSAGATEATFASVASFPAPKYYRARIDDELIGITGGATTTLHVDRGLESTTAASHVSGAAVEQILTAGALEALKQDAAAVGYSTINVVIDGGGSAITTGVKVDLVVDFACTIAAWTLLADQSGAIKVDLWADTYASYPPTDADSICGGHEPEIAASGVKAQDTDLADWSGEAIAAGSVIRVNVDSCATIERATLALKVQRTSLSGIVSHSPSASASSSPSASASASPSGSASASPSSSPSSSPSASSSSSPSSSPSAS